MQAITDFRGSPAVLLFHSSKWDPAEPEIVETYNRLIASLRLPHGATAKLVRVTRAGGSRHLTFDDAALSVPVIEADASLADATGMSGGFGVIVLDAEGKIRWRHDANGQLSTAELARAVTDAALGDQDRTKAGWSRRQFVATVFGVAAALTLRPTFAHAEQLTADPRESAAAATSMITLNVNGKDLSLDLESRVTLLDALREYAGLTGTKKGCDLGQCGACTLHIDGKRALSCLSLAIMQQGKKITTIEGLANGDALHPMQQAFITHDGFQCGYCTPGQIMSAAAMVCEPWGATDADVREAMSGNLCRCGAYVGIVAAIQDVRAHAPRAAQ